MHIRPVELQSSPHVQALCMEQYERDKWHMKSSEGFFFFTCLLPTYSSNYFQILWVYSVCCCKINTCSGLENPLLGEDARISEFSLTLAVLSCSLFALEELTLQQLKHKIVLKVKHPVRK